jgi:hypothetical protein
MTASRCIRLVLCLGILFSIATVYYSKIVLQDFEIITNPDGMPIVEE